MRRPTLAAQLGPRGAAAFPQELDRCATDGRASTSPDTTGTSRTARPDRERGRKQEAARGGETEAARWPLVVRIPNTAGSERISLGARGAPTCRPQTYPPSNRTAANGNYGTRVRPAPARCFSAAPKRAKRSQHEAYSVSCTMAGGQTNRQQQRKTQSALMLFCHLMPSVHGSSGAPFSLLRTLESGTNKGVKICKFDGPQTWN
jgi:hypothetical protein